MRWLVITTALATALGPVALFSCSDDDAKPAAVANDAATRDAPLDAEPCATYSGVGTACNVPRTRICFSQCTTGGCFCENGKWACINDTSCFRDADLFGDVVTPPPPDASTDAIADAASDG